MAIVAIFIIMAIFAYRAQLMKSRDARRKADLKKIQNVLEDYLNDSGYYPGTFICGDTQGTLLEGYANEVPCDPVNNIYYNYFYSYDSLTPRKSWYKIYTKLENTNDPLIASVGCGSGCGPDNNYNYYVSSPNVSTALQEPGEDWWPAIPGTTPTPTSAAPGPTSTPVPTNTPTLAPTPTPTSGAGPTATPTLAPTATPTSSPGDNYYGCFSGVCLPISGPEQCPSINYLLPDCGGQCVNPINECH